MYSVDRMRLTETRKTSARVPAKEVCPSARSREPRRAAAKLVGVLAGESPARGTCPVAPVVISGGGAGDQSVESPEVKVLVGWVKTWSAPTGGQANRQVVTKANGSEAPKLSPSRESECEDIGSAETLSTGRRPASTAKELGIGSRGTPGVSDDDMSIKNSQRKHGTTRWSPRRRTFGRTARAFRISRVGEVEMCWRVGRMGPHK
jgi:hypothetical protein